MITATRPGTMALVESSSSLNQTRTSTVSGGAAGLDPAAVAGAVHRAAGGEAARHLGHRALQVALDQGGGVGVAAVDHRLHPRRPRGAEAAREVGRDDEDDLGAAGVERRRHLVGTGEGVDDGEVAGGAEGVDEGAALLRQVLVEHRGAHVAHVEGDGVAEEHQQQHRHGEGDDQAAAVAAQLDRLLACDGPQAARSHHRSTRHPSTAPPVSATRATKTSSREGAIGSMPSTATPASVSRRRTRAAPSPPSSSRRSPARVTWTARP